MSLEPPLYADCYLLTDVDFNSERVYHILERRFKSNSSETSFDFKLLPPERPSNNAKVSRSLLRCQPILKYIHNYEDEISTDSSSSEGEEGEENNEEDRTTNDDEDDYLDKLAEWEPSDFQPSLESDEEETTIQPADGNNNISEDYETSPMDISSNSKSDHQSPGEDLLVTYIHRPLKSEPIPYEENIFDSLPQLDGQIDFPAENTTSQATKTDDQKHFQDVIARVLAKQQKTTQTIQLHQPPAGGTKFRLNDDMRKKSALSPPKRPPLKIDRAKEPVQKAPRSMKKVASRLMSSVMKTNQTVIRPLNTPMPTTPTNSHSRVQKPFRSSSENLSPAFARRISNPPKPIGKKEQLTSQQRSTSLSTDKSPSSSQSKGRSARHYMSLAEKELTHFQKREQTRINSLTSPYFKAKSKEKKKTRPQPPIASLDTRLARANSTPTAVINNPLYQKKKKKIKQIKRLDKQSSRQSMPSKTILPSKEKKAKSIENHISTKVPLITQRSEPAVMSSTTTSKRAADFFEGCIVLDDDDDANPASMAIVEDNEDDDIQEIEQLRYSIAYNIRSREKLLDHAIHSSPMHVQWLFNLEHVLLEHISICHENNIRPRTLSPLQSTANLPNYQIEPSLISNIIINFLKMFILRNSSTDQQEVFFLQFGLTSHLRYLLIELPTYVHSEEKELEESCSKCHQYSLLIIILFDLLFDLMEYDLCENQKTIRYRSSLIEDDYFARFLKSKSTHKDPYYRIKMLIYFLELIGIHMSKCGKNKQFQFNKNENKLFLSIEDFLRKILCQKKPNESLSICFNVLELCLLFVNEKVTRIQEISLFLVNLCEINSSYIDLFLFDKHLLPDIRLLFINELISQKYSMKLTSIDRIQEFFTRTEKYFDSTETIDVFPLHVLRSLFNTYADLIIEMMSLVKHIPTSQEELKIILQTEFDSIYQSFLKISSKNQQSFEQIKSTLFFFRLLKCKWNKLYIRAV